MRLDRTLADRAGDLALRSAKWSLPLSFVFVVVMWELPGWVGAGRFPWFLNIAFLPSVSCALIGLGAILLGLRWLHSQAVLGGILAVVSGGVQMLVVGFMLGMGSIS